MPNAAWLLNPHPLSPKYESNAEAFIWTLSGLLPCVASPGLNAGMFVMLSCGSRIVLMLFPMAVRFCCSALWYRRTGHSNTSCCSLKDPNRGPSVGWVRALEFSFMSKVSPGKATSHKNGTRVPGAIDDLHM